MFSENQPQEELSKFNEAGLQILRLNELWIKAEHYANIGSLGRWHFILDSIWRELYPDVIRMPNSKEMIERNKKILSSIFNSRHKRFNFYSLISKRHEFLKEIQDKAGKGSSYEAVNEQDFD